MSNQNNPHSNHPADHHCPLDDRCADTVSRLAVPGTGQDGLRVSNLNEQMRRCDKMAMVGELAAGLAHEIGTPLTVIQGTVEYLLMDLPEAESCRQEFETILSQTGRITRLMEQLLAFSRSSSADMRPLSINRLLEQVLDLISYQICKYNCRMTTDFEDALPLFPGDLNQLTHAFLNIILNAAQSLPGSGSVSIRTTAHSNPHPWVVVSITDTGSGIAEEHLNRIFDPFFSTRTDGRSTGLGLTASRHIIHHHGGIIDVASTVNQGSVFTVKLPALKDDRSDS